MPCVFAPDRSTVGSMITRHRLQKRKSSDDGEFCREEAILTIHNGGCCSDSSHWYVPELLNFDLYRIIANLIHLGLIPGDGIGREVIPVCTSRKSICGLDIGPEHQLTENRLVDGFLSHFRLL